MCMEPLSAADSHLVRVVTKGQADGAALGRVVQNGGGAVSVDVADGLRW